MPNLLRHNNAIVILSVLTLKWKHLSFSCSIFSEKQPRGVAIIFLTFSVIITGLVSLHFIHVVNNWMYVKNKLTCSLFDVRMSSTLSLSLKVVTGVQITHIGERRSRDSACNTII